MKKILFVALLLLCSVATSVSLASSADKTEQVTNYELSLSGDSSVVIKNLQDFSGSSAILSVELTVPVTKQGFVDSVYSANTIDSNKVDACSRGSPKK